MTIRLERCGTAVARFVTPPVSSDGRTSADEKGKPLANHLPTLQMVLTPGATRFVFEVGGDNDDKQELEADWVDLANLTPARYAKGPNGLLSTNDEGRLTIPARHPRCDVSNCARPCGGGQRSNCKHALRRPGGLPDQGASGDGFHGQGGQARRVAGHHRPAAVARDHGHVDPSQRGRCAMTKSDGPWAPYEPTKENPWDLQKVAHLHRRAGFGAAMAELQRDLGAGPEASVARFLQPREETAEEREVTASLRDGALRSPGSELERLRAYWLYRIVFHPDALREKMTLFWHNHFATSNNKVRSVDLMLRQNECFRRHALGEFAALLADLVADFAMLIWLDGGVSRKERPNENFAREFLELFTLGVGHYSEAGYQAGRPRLHRLGGGSKT